MPGYLTAGRQIEALARQESIADIIEKKISPAERECVIQAGEVTNESGLSIVRSWTGRGRFVWIDSR